MLFWQLLLKESTRNFVIRGYPRKRLYLFTFDGCTLVILQMKTKKPQNALYEICLTPDDYTSYWRKRWETLETVYVESVNKIRNFRITEHVWMVLSICPSHLTAFVPSARTIIVAFLIKNAPIFGCSWLVIATDLCIKLTFMYISTNNNQLG
jgi:hypothetical protein